MPDDRPPLLAALRVALNRLASDGLGSEQARQALATHAERLRREAGHLPQAARLADAVDRCAELPAPEAAIQLLKVLVAVQQLGPDPAPLPAPGPDRRPLPAVRLEASFTPLAPELLIELRSAFSRRGAPPSSILELLQRPELGKDVRTRPLLEAGLSHPHLRAAATAALIRMGPDVAPRLRTRFNRRGDQTDAARLEVLLAVESKSLTQLLLESARRGSAPVRRVALEALAARSDLTPDAREAVILEAYEAASESERPGLAKALALLGTDPALCHLAMLTASGALSETRLRELLAPAQIARWLHLVEEAVPGFSRSAAFFQLLEDWDVPEARALLVQRSHDPDLRVRRLAFEARLASPDPAALRSLAEQCLPDEALRDVAVTALQRLDPGTAFSTLGPLVEAWLHTQAPAPDAPSPPHWIHLAHQLGARKGEARRAWWARLDALMQARGRMVSRGCGPLQPNDIRERKEG